MHMARYSRSQTIRHCYHKQGNGNLESIIRYTSSAIHNGSIHSTAQHQSSTPGPYVPSSRVSTHPKSTAPSEKEVRPRMQASRLTSTMYQCALLHIHTSHPSDPTTWAVGWTLGITVAPHQQCHLTHQQYHQPLYK